jgi:biotin carboxyl carrier protein
MTEANGSAPLDIEAIERLAELVSASAVSEVTLRSGDSVVTIRKGRERLAKGPRPLEEIGPPNAATTIATREVAPGPAWIAAPMVGVFHPAEPPVRKGTVVEVGQVVGMIESMKLMNDVRAAEPGVVSEVAIEADMPVEYGQHLFGLAR